MSQVCCQESRSRRLWFDASDQFTEPDERQRVGKIEGKKEEQGRELEPVEVINASMRAILGICCPMRQDVSIQEQATLVSPLRGLSQRERCSVGRKDNPHCKHYRCLSYCLPGKRSGPASEL